MPAPLRDNWAEISRRLRASGRSMTCALGVLVVLWHPQAPRAQDDASTKPPSQVAEYQLKAAFLFRLPSFIEWPAGEWPLAGSPFYACILGKDPFGVHLDYFDGKSVRGRRFTVRRLEKLEEADTCHLLYVGLDEGADLSSVLAGLRHRCVLTVGEGREFTAHGGIVGFVVAKQRVRLTVNLDASRDAGLEISSKLLDVASIVKGSE